VSGGCPEGDPRYRNNIPYIFGGDVEIWPKRITDLILAVVELLERDMSRLVVEAREALEPVEPWDEG
jgi:hypothetical protein